MRTRGSTCIHLHPAKTLVERRLRLHSKTYSYAAIRQDLLEEVGTDFSIKMLREYRSQYLEPNVHAAADLQKKKRAVFDAYTALSETAQLQTRRVIVAASREQPTKLSEQLSKEIKLLHELLGSLHAANVELGFTPAAQSRETTISEAFLKGVEMVRKLEREDAEKD